MNNQTTCPRYPCTAMPTDAHAQRLLGLYPQRQEGLWMQRLRVPAGTLSADQWRLLADIGRQFSTSEPLHLTTRHDIELHGLTAEMIPQVQKRLADGGLTCIGACGDTIRNVTVCPCSGMGQQLPDVAPLAAQLADLLLQQPGSYSLPRKFKVSISSCDDGCAQPWINDLGLVALEQNGGVRFRAIVAGSLGAKPATGVAFPQSLAAGEVPALTLAALRVFAAHGDRERRSLARLRHVRQRLGDEAFMDLLVEQFELVRQERQWEDIRIERPTATFSARRNVGFVNGDVTPQAAEGIARLVDNSALRVRITNFHQLAVFGIDEATVDAALGDAGLVASRGPTIVACPGTRWCSRGLASTQSMANRLAEVLSEQEGDTLIALSGCPNGCAQSSVADIGLVGLAQGPADNRREVWNVLTGGGRGRDGRLAQTVGERLSPEETVAEVLRRVKSL